jgi:CRP-like cAMP-binding protein
MAVKDWLPAGARSAAIDHKLKAGEPLFRLGDETMGLCEVVTGRVRLARVDRSDAKLSYMWPGRAKRSLRLLCFLPNIIVTL